MQTKTLDHIIDVESTKNEYQRLKIFSVVLFVGFCMAVINSQFYQTERATIFGDAASFHWVILWTLGYLIVCIASLYFVRSKVQRQGVLSQRYVVLNLVIESLLPGILLFVLSSYIKSPILVDSPVVFLYFPIIIVSALHLNFRLSMLTGLIAAGSYLFIISWVFTFYADHPVHQLYLPPSVYYSRVVILVLSGICAGFVGVLLKRRIVTAVKSLEEKNKIENLFSQQVSEKVMETLTKEKDFSKKLDATILFLDIRDFSNAAQTKSPEEVIQFQNNFFSPILSIVNKHNGVVNQILGDGLMVSFGAPVADARHADAAFGASLEIFELIGQKPDFGFDNMDVRIGIGVHSGTVITGNIGNESRKQFSISGTPIIIAARLEQLNKKYHTSFLTSGKFFRRLSNQDIRVKKHGKTQVKGIDEEVEIIEILI